MKKYRIFFSFVFITLIMNTLNAQLDGRWVLAEAVTAYEVVFTPGELQYVFLGGSCSGENKLFSAGGYDDNEDLQFFVVDNMLYDPENGFEDSFTYENTSVNNLSPEIEIIKIPGGEDNSYFIFHTRYSPTSPYTEGFCYTKVEYVENNGYYSIIEKSFYDENELSMGAIAIGQEKNEGGEIVRDLYSCSVKFGIRKRTINSLGVEDDYTLIVDWNNTTFNDYMYFGAYNMEMIINNDGNYLLAWISKYDVGNEYLFMYEITGTGVGTGNKYKIDIERRINGIEFSPFDADIIYLSCDAGDTPGIYEYNISTSSLNFLENSGDYKRTFLQTAKDDHIYAVSYDGLYLGRINTNTGDFEIEVFNAQLVTHYINSSTNFYILPQNSNYYFYWNLDVDVNHISCVGNCDGYAEATPSSGEIEDYTWEWKDEYQNVISTTNEATDLCEGEYTVCATHITSGNTVCETVNIELDPALWDYNNVAEYPSASVPQSPWDNENLSFARGLTIKSGETLELVNNTTLMFGKDAKLIIEPGATLIVNNSTLTKHSSCPDMWAGVQVWGNEEKSQLIHPEEGTQWQGKLDMTSVTIEHAKIAVDLWKPGDDEKTGGIVTADDVTFSNNNKAVHAVHYYNFDPVNEKYMDNISYFKYCTFEITGDYLAELDFYKHVDLVDVDGIKFKACNFTLQAGVNGVSQWNNGIAAYNAGFDVQAVCSDPFQNPCTDYDGCTFTGFNKGIHSANTLTTNTFTVNRAEFNNNTIGIYANLINNLYVLRSVFKIDNNGADDEECEGEGNKGSGYGINLNGCTGFAIEDNEFQKAQGAPTGYYTGIRIAETQATDEVYNNDFVGLSYGNFAVGKNWYLDEIYQGLAYFCNENVGNYQDFKVASGDPSGIQSEIGGTEHAAGNTFTSGANNNFNNLGNHEVEYFYYTGNPPEYPEIVTNVNRTPVGIENECLSHYGGGSGRGMVLSPVEKQEAEQEFSTSLTDYNNVKALYENLIDGGNTEATLTDVETAWPDDMWELRAELLGKSPHLSMEVLKKAADKTDVLPESIIFEIMAANPDELKKEELIKYLEDKENPLPTYMIDILRQVSTGTTYKTVLHQQMAFYNRLKTRAAHDIIRSLLNDTVIDYAELRNWLDNVGGKRADEQIIATYVQEENYTDALALANTMPAFYNYNDEEVVEHNYYAEMLNFQIGLAQSNRTIFDLDATEISNLVVIADNSNGTAGAQAKGILEFAYNYHYCNCLDVSDNSGYKSIGNINYDAFNKVFGPDVEVKPNPANEWTSFNYTLPNNETEGVIKISDVAGKIIETFVVTGSQGQKIWDTRKIKQGVYLYTFKVNGLSKSGKIVITK